MTERIDPIVAQIAELRQEVRANTQRLDIMTGRLDDVVKGLHAVDKRIDQMGVRLVMWSAGFWIAAVGGVAALAGVLRR